MANMARFWRRYRCRLPTHQLKHTNPLKIIQLPVVARGPWVTLPQLQGCRHNTTSHPLRPLAALDRDHRTLIHSQCNLRRQLGVLGLNKSLGRLGQRAHGFLTTKTRTRKANRRNNGRNWPKQSIRSVDAICQATLHLNLLCIQASKFGIERSK